MDTYYIIQWDVLRRVFVFSGYRKMPSDIVSVVVSTGLGVSVLAGILSGVCYVLAQTRNSRKIASEWHCNVCGTNIRTLNNILNGDKSVVTCSKCHKRTCRSQCSTFNQNTGKWMCKSCLSTPASWFKGILDAFQPNNQKSHWLSEMSLPRTIGQNESTEETDGGNEKEKVRDFLERLINVMLGDNVDDASITKIYNDKLYLPIRGQSPCSAHAALKQIIERLLHESGALPKFKATTPDHPAAPSDENDRTYEDLLATAIINKVISNSQSNLPTSSRASVSSRLSNSSRHHDKEYFFGEETLDSKWKTTDLETSSVSSIEDWIHSDSSFGSRKYIDKVTLTIKQNIEEVSQSDSDVEDDSEYFRTKSSLFSDDEPNWFLQKRQFQGTHSPVPVPMLVPNPTTEAKVLIGDKEIDETSDLSDIASDFEDTEALPSRHSLLIESKTVIGGKNLLLQTTGSESESSADSGVKEVDDGTEKNSFDVADGVTPPRSLRADITVDDDNVEDASILSVYSNTEQEAEYTERYASLPRTMLKSPVPPKRTSLEKSKILEKVIQETNNNQINKLDLETNASDEKLADPFELDTFSGSYSRREKEKWKHAIEMENNPYSKENIEKRIKRSSSLVSSIFGPDYYARQASSPAGTKKSHEVRGIAWPPPEQPEEEVQEAQITLSDESLMNSSSNNDSVEIVEDNVFVSENKIEPKVQLRAVPFQMPARNHSDTTSDTDLSCTHYYDVENSKVSIKHKVNNTETFAVEKKPNHFERNAKSSSTPTTERPTFIKMNSVSQSKKLKESSPMQNNTMKRHKSESDLLESIDLRPRGINRKKDNTLISKIYSNPQVRQFALSSRNQLPIDESTQQEYSMSSNGKRLLYQSDDGMSRTQISLFSSNEDLLNSKEDASFVGKNRTHPARRPKYSFSSDDDLLSESGSILGNSPEAFNGNLKMKNERNEKIRNLPRLQSPLSASKRFSSDENLLSDDSKTSQNRPKSILLNKSPLHSNEGQIDFERKSATPSPDIEELAKKKIVHHILDQITNKTNANVIYLANKKNDAIVVSDGHSAKDDIISVKDLRKRFENNDTTNKVVSSLTARSLSKQMREELKN